MELGIRFQPMGDLEIQFHCIYIIKEKVVHISNTIVQALYNFMRKV